jgi:hypothetical protein
MTAVLPSDEAIMMYNSFSRHNKSTFSTLLILESTEHLNYRWEKERSETRVEIQLKSKDAVVTYKTTTYMK